MIDLKLLIIRQNRILYKI